MKQCNVRRVLALLLALLLPILCLGGCAGASPSQDETTQAATSTKETSLLDGAVNVRDIGGYPTQDGKRVRRGMIFRGSEIDGLYEPYVLTETGRDYALNTLHIRSDFDLRGATIKPLPKSFFGENVQYYCFNIRAYNHIFSSAYMPAMADIFSGFAKEENYPLYLHCTHGLDRTGTVCYILEALLGMSAEDIDSEYRLSFEAFPDNAVNTEDYDRFVMYFDALNGETYRAKAWNYLVDCGVTEKELHTIINLLTE